MSLPQAKDKGASGVDVDNCWGQVGVAGDRSCEELEQHSHCRNCATFASAAARLLDREISADLSYSLADQPAGQRWGGSPEEHADKESIAVFRLGGEWFALPTTALDEIIASRPIHTLPHRRHPALLGLINVRGQLVVCISVAQLLLGAPTVSSVDRLLVARHAGGRFAFPVDEIQHTLQYPRSELKPAPSTVARSASSYTKGLVLWRDRTIARLDEELLFEGLGRCLA